MRVVPAIDLMHAKVVRGVAGERATYRPIESRLTGSSAPGDIAAALAGGFGFSTAYVADLDAIAGETFDVGSYERIADAGLCLWIDAGIGNRRRADQFVRATVRHGCIEGVILGLESLKSRDELPGLLDMLGTERAIFSLDLKQSQPLTAIEEWRSAQPLDIIEAVADAGLRRVLLLDLANVGMNRGTTTLDLCEQVSRRHRDWQIIAGGGVRGLADLLRMQASGCSAALVASALHSGQFTRSQLDSLHGKPLQ